MLVATIDLWRFGYESQKKNLRTMVIWNDGTGDHNTGNYEYRISHGSQHDVDPHDLVRGRAHAWRKGRIENFPRLRENEAHLLARVLNDAGLDKS